MKKHLIFSSPWGNLKIVRSQKGLTSLSFEDFQKSGRGKEVQENQSELCEDDPQLLKAKEQILQYAQGKRKSFSLSLDFSEATEFQQRAWLEMAKIPFGETSTYGELATACGSPKGARALGGAANKNPLPLIIPCHRVVGSKGLLTGFAMGLGLKSALLSHEGLKPDVKSIS